MSYYFHKCVPKNKKNNRHAKLLEWALCGDFCFVIDKVEINFEIKVAFKRVG